jgi:hypothetical protein
MKTARIAMGVFGAGLLFASGAFAQELKGRLHLDETVAVAGTQVKPGDYKVEWKGDGPQVEVSLVQGKRTVATFPGRVSEQAAASIANAYSVNDASSGAKSIDSIYFAGKRYVLQIEGSASARQNQPDSTASSK